MSIAYNNGWNTTELQYLHLGGYTKDFRPENSFKNELVTLTTLALAKKELSITTTRKLSFDNWRTRTPSTK